MKHSDVQDHMADYLEGDLPLEKRALFDAHLDDCEACLGEIRDVQRTITLLRSLPEPQVPSGFTESVMRRVRENEDRQSLLENLREAFGILLSPRILVPLSVSMIVLGIIAGNDKIEDALLLESQRTPFAASDRPVAPFLRVSPARESRRGRRLRTELVARRLFRSPFSRVWPPMCFLGPCIRVRPSCLISPAYSVPRLPRVSGDSRVRLRAS